MSTINYTSYADFLQQKLVIDQPSGFEPGEITPLAFDFQRAVIRWALVRGRAAVFMDTGLGKTAVQVIWADHVNRHTGKNVLILAPLCVSLQTVNEAKKFGVTVNYCRDQSKVIPGITITNYEMLDHFDPYEFVGVVLDESSILKSQSGKTRKAITDSFRKTPYRLSCTATPSPNDHMELGTQAEFLGIMSATEMLAMFFTHDGSDTSKWRLKGHAKERFWEWMASWSVVMQNPSDLGFDGSRFILPPLNIHNRILESSYQLQDQLFPGAALTLSERRESKRLSIDDRVAEVAKMVNSSDEKWIVWCHLNDESKALAAAIPDGVEIRGDMDIDEKESKTMAFINGTARVLISKSSISGFGLNLQFCHNMIFVGLDDSWERYYQSIRRCWRFGQDHPVNVYTFSTDSDIAVLKNLERKEAQSLQMIGGMISHMREFTKMEINKAAVEKTEYSENEASGKGWKLYMGDCVEVCARIKDNSIDYSIFSPPFASLYTYSNSDRDMGNCKSYDDFYNHFRFLIVELYRVLKPGRLLSFHCMNLPTTKQNHGVIGLHDFRGELIRMFAEAGWIYHSEVVIWKDPVTAMQRTKAIGLLHKQLKKDSCISRQGIPDYLVTMRKPGENPDPVTKTNETFPVALWQRYASPIWMDINQSNTLQFRNARDNDDERHIAPLQLEVIERGIELWTNPGDIVLSPFAGIGSEGYVAIKMGRKFIGVELKESYWNVACKNLREAESSQFDLFSEVG